MTTSPAPVTLEQFFEQVAHGNPFLDNRVNGLSSPDVDVDDIHRAAFSRLTTLAFEARDERRGIGVVLWGEAGIGKSHLLARLARWADQDHRACAVYLHNLQASPENLPRSLLKAVVSILTHGKSRGFLWTPLFQLALAFVRESLNHNTAVRYPWPIVERAFGHMVDGLSAEDPSQAALVHRTVYDVFYRFFRSAYRSLKTHEEREAILAVRWLSGDSLDPNEARQLGLPVGRDPKESAVLEDNQQIKQVLVALSRMALSNHQPFLLCFDQVDNLEDDQASAMARFLQALLDSAPNLLVVTAGVQATMVRWRETGVIQSSAWDRLGQFEILLQRLTPEESRRILAARVKKVVAPFVDLEPLRQRASDELFPLGQAWAEAFFQNKIELRPREAINAARDGWRRMQESLRQRGGSAWLDNGGVLPPTEDLELTAEQILEAIDRKVAQKIAEQCDLRRSKPQEMPPDADNLAGLLFTLLRQEGSLAIDRPPLGRPDKDYPYSLVARHRVVEGRLEMRTGIRIFASSSAKTTTAALRWLVKDTAPPERVLLITDERCGLAFGGQTGGKGRAYYDSLRRREQGRFHHLTLTFEQYAQLDALQAVVGMARSGDLEIELPGGKTRRVSEEEVIESHRRQGRYLNQPVLRDLLVAPASEG